MLLDPRHLEQLAAIIDHGTMQEAATRLGTSQPALSRMVRQLETRIGEHLFDRGSRPLVATEMGLKLSDQGRAIKAARERATEEIDLRARGMGGALKIGAPPFLCERIVGDAIAAFFDNRADIKVTLVPDYFPELERAVLLNQIDMVICPIKLIVAAKVELRVEPIFQDEHVIVSRKDHPLARHGTISKEDLEGATWISPSNRSLLSSDMATALASIGVTNLNFAFQSESAGATFEMLRKTDFLTVLPRYAISQTQADSGLAVLPVKFASGTLMVGMMSLKAREESPLLRAFKDHIRKHVGEPDVRPKAV